jgi:hypothetical protein
MLYFWEFDYLQGCFQKVQKRFKGLDRPYKNWSATTREKMKEWSVKNKK